MTPDQEPIPREALPPGWGPADHEDERIAYSRGDPRVELIAAQTEADRSHPALGLGRCWELRYRHTIGEFPVMERLGCVSTRRAAVEGLLRCMHRVHDRVDDPSDPIAVQAALDGVRFNDFVPDQWSPNSP